jgi:hypothetical protein
VQFNSSIHGTTPKDIMDLLILTQYFDALQVRFAFFPILIFCHALYLIECVMMIRKSAGVGIRRQCSSPLRATPFVLV